MSVRVSPYGGDRWEADIRVRLADGKRVRERRVFSSSKSTAQRWAEQRERHLLQHGLPPEPKEVPTLEQFASRFLDEHARANRQKPSSIAAKESIVRVHLVPLLGSKKLDAITNDIVQGVKHGMAARAPKTVNNVLTVLSKMLKTAVEWNVIERMPCTIKLLRVPKARASFHDFGPFERLVEASRSNANAYLIVLLGGEAGLRCGEMMALEWSDVDFDSGQLHVQRSQWKGYVTDPKGNRPRCVPLTHRLSAALRQHRHLKSNRILCSADGSPLTQRQVQGLVARAARRANLSDVGVHVLRHTFCSHLSMKGATPRAIQELAGHQNLSTTLRYMHVSSAAVESAIRLLDSQPIQMAGGGCGEAAFAAP